MRQRILSAIIIGVCLIGCPGVEAAGLGSGTCQILDAPLDHLYEVGVTYIPSSRFDGYGKSAALELGVDWAFGYVKDFGGEMDFNLVFQDILFLHSAGLELPSQLGEIAADLGFAMRSSKGTAVQIRLMPGFYSDLEAIYSDSFFIPVSCAAIRAFTPDFSGMVGLEARPGFERVLMPIVGLAWKISDDFRLDAGLPHSRLQWAITPKLRTVLGFDWQNTSYSLSDPDDASREQITLEDFRTYWGMTLKASDILQFNGEIGRAFNRSIAFDSNSEIDIEDSLYVTFAIGAPF